MFKRENSLERGLMGTLLSLYGDVSRRVLEECFNLGLKMEEELSAFLDSSYISKINKSAGVSWVEVPERVLKVLKVALWVCKRTGGYYDPTVGALTLRRGNRVGCSGLKIEGNRVFLEEGLSLDLGGIGKGFAVSQMYKFLKGKGASKVLINLGGEIICEGKNFKIGVRHPRKGKILLKIKTKRALTSITTSGDYERFEGSFNEHHIFNPRNGRRENYYSSLTLIALGDRITYLDAYATALFNMPPEEALTFCEEEDLGFLATDKLCNLFLKEGFSKYLEGVELLEV